MYLMYSLIYLIALVFILPFEYLKRPKELRRRWIKERFGFLDIQHGIRDKKQQVIWIHAVSVGEVIAAASLINKLKQRYPAAEIIISTVTDTGRRVATERAGDFAKIIYMPFDLPFTIKNTVRHISPSVFIIMETELWPNTIRILSINVPILLMNGRISERSFNGYRKLSFFIKDVLKGISIFCMQNEIYAAKIKALGAEPEKVMAIGSFKFDTMPSLPVPEWTGMLHGPVIIAGSTHKTEEDLIIDTYVKLKSDFPQLNLIVAPRHPERFKEVEELMKKKGLKYLKRSEFLKHKTQTVDGSRLTVDGSRFTVHGSRFTGVIIILDVIGELASVYGACDVAIMGGTFIKHGGQNPLEPAYWSKAIVCGPHMENFPFIDEFYRNGGALKVDSANLYQSLKGLLSSPEKMASIGSAANRLCGKRTGAIERAMEVIGKYVAI